MHDVQERAWTATLAAAVARAGDRFVIDAGCGRAAMAEALAAVLPEARVVAFDTDPEVVREARERLSGTRIEVCEANMDAGGRALQVSLGGRADLVWAAASVHHAADQQAAVSALVSLLAPGGRVALAEGGLPIRCLPWDLGIGEPGLEIRLEAAQQVWFARMRAELPGAVRMPYGWTAAMRHAGLSRVITRTHLREDPPPLGAAGKQHLVEMFRKRVGRLEEAGLLPAADAPAWRRLLDPEDPAYLANRCDLQYLSATSIHIGAR